MANGRLAKCVINPYSSGFVYQNTSGSQASISIGAQVLDQNTNSDITVALEDTARTVSASASVQTFCAPTNCIATVLTNPDNSYQGFYAGNGGCFHPIYTNCNGTVTCYPYRNSTVNFRVRAYCFAYYRCETCTYICCNLCPGPFSLTLSVSDLVVNRNAYDNPHFLKDEKGYPYNDYYTISFDCNGCTYQYNSSTLTNEQQRAINFVRPTCTSTIPPQSDCCCCSNQYLAAAVDYWSENIGSFGVVDGGYCYCSNCPSTFIGVCCTGCYFSYSPAVSLTCSCESCRRHIWGVTSTCYCCCTNQIYSFNIPAQANAGIAQYTGISDHVVCPAGSCVCISYGSNTEACFTAGRDCVYTSHLNAICSYYLQFTSKKGPSILSGCNLQVIKVPYKDCLYYFNGFNCPCQVATCISGSCEPCTLRFYTGENLTCCNICGGVDTSIFPIKWLSYNPVNECNYFMYFGSSKDRRGIYSVKWDKVCCTSTQSCACEGYCSCTGFGLTSFDTFFTKVADLPSPLVDCNHLNFCPTPIFRTGKTSWRFSVDDSGTWKEYCSEDMVNWYPRSSFHQPVSGGSFSTTGTTILRCCDCFDSVIAASTYIDYKVSINNYERTGLVVSNNDRIYIKNPSGYELAVNVWGYEG